MSLNNWVILFSKYDYIFYYHSLWPWYFCMKLHQSMNIWLALYILMTWCFNTRASVAAVLSMHSYVSSCLWVNRFRLGQRGWHFAGNIFTQIFLEENSCFVIHISLKFASVGPNDSMPAFLQVKACHYMCFYLSQWWPCSLSHMHHQNPVK